MSGSVTLDPIAERALESYTTKYRTHLTDVAISLVESGTIITKADIDAAHDTIQRLHLPEPPLQTVKQHFVFYSLNQLGTVIMGGAGGMMFSALDIIREESATRWMILLSVYFVAGLLLVIATRER